MPVTEVLVKCIFTHEVKKIMSEMRYYNISTKDLKKSIKWDGFSKFLSKEKLHGRIFAYRLLLVLGEAYFVYRELKNTEKIKFWSK